MHRTTRLDFDRPDDDLGMRDADVDVDLVYLKVDTAHYRGRRYIEKRGPRLGLGLGKVEGTRAAATTVAATAGATATAAASSGR